MARQLGLVEKLVVLVAGLPAFRLFACVKTRIELDSLLERALRIGTYFVILILLLVRLLMFRGLRAFLERLTAGASSWHF